MPRSATSIPVKGDVLIWARRSLGLSEEDAADKLKVSLNTLREWEGGSGVSGITQLRRIATVYKRPVAALLQPEAPPLPPMPTDFATVQGAEPHFSAQTLVAIRDAQRIQRIATELLTADPDLFPDADLPQYSDSDSPQEAGIIERGALNVDIATQLAWRDANRAFNTWRAKMQMAGIIVLAKSLPREDCPGFSLYGPELAPVVVVSSREADQAKTFTMFHEYGHLARRGDGICQERDGVHPEVWCNRFSAALLVPFDALRTAARPSVDTTQDVQDIAWRFQVSRHVIAIRLVEMGLTAPDMYERIKAEDNERQDWEKPSFRDEEEEFPGRPMEAVRLSELGFGYTNLVVAAMESGLIGPTEASDFLDIRHDKFGPLRETAKRAAARYA